MDALLAGHARFLQGYWRRHEELFGELARHGQSPHAMVIACSDSRVAPEIIFDCAPGEIFVVRNISNLVPPYQPGATHGVEAALEYAVTVLKVRLIVVLGHSQCGGIRALMQGAGAASPFLNDWVALARTARARVCDAPGAPAALETLCGLGERESIRVSLENLRGFSWISEKVGAGELTLAGLHFDVATGQLENVA